MARSQKTNSFKMHYDKIIVVAVLLALLLSLFCLIRLTSSQRDHETSFNDKLNALRPTHENAAELSDNLFNSTLSSLTNPYALTKSTMLLACERVACVSCGWPIKMDDKICHYCNAVQPDDTVGSDWDSDSDGIADIDEKKVGLNPLEAKDAAGDLDLDGFTNLEEYKAKTDLADAKSHPPRVDFLRVQKIDAIRFPYVLRGKTNLGKGAFKFQVNDLIKNQSFFVKIGDEINKSGFKAVAYTNKIVVVKKAGVPERKKELGVLKLSSVKGDDEVELVEGEEAGWNSFEITLVCVKDKDGGKPIVTKQRESFTFDGETYKVVKIARESNTSTGKVVIKQESTQREINVPEL